VKPECNLVKVRKRLDVGDVGVDGEDDVILTTFQVSGVPVIKTLSFHRHF
jgi:hypothetical protein